MKISMKQFFISVLVLCIACGVISNVALHIKHNRNNELSIEMRIIMQTISMQLASYCKEIGPAEWESLPDALEDLHSHGYTSETVSGNYRLSNGKYPFDTGLDAWDSEIVLLKNNGYPYAIRSLGPNRTDDYGAEDDLQIEFRSPTAKNSL